MGVSRALSAFRALIDTTNVEYLNDVGCNPGHNKHLDMVSVLGKKRRYKLSRVLRRITRNKNLGINRVKNLFPKKKTVSLISPGPKTPVAENGSKFTPFPENGIETTLAWVNAV